MAGGDTLSDAAGNVAADAGGNPVGVGADPARCCSRAGRVCGGSGDPVFEATGGPPYVSLDAAPLGTETYEILGVCYVFDGPVEYCPRPHWPVGTKYPDCTTCEANADLEPIPCAYFLEGNHVPIPLPPSFVLIVTGVVITPCPFPGHDPHSTLASVAGVNVAHAFTETSPGGNQWKTSNGGSLLKTWYENVGGSATSDCRPAPGLGIGFSEQQDPGTYGFWQDTPDLGFRGGQILVGGDETNGLPVSVLILNFTIECVVGPDGNPYFEAVLGAGDVYADVSGVTLELLY